MKINHNLLNTGRQNHMIFSKNPRLFSIIICILRTIVYPQSHQIHV